MCDSIWDFSRIGAIIVNSTPKYFYLLDAFFGMYFRYRNNFQWPVYFATEVTDHPIVRMLEEKYPLQVLVLPSEQSDFLESRKAALELLPTQVKYVLMLQEDFLLERPGIKEDDINEMVHRMEHDANIHSVRLMPCPGPKGTVVAGQRWAPLDVGADEYYFTFQASVWRRDSLFQYLDAVIRQTCSGPGIPKKRTREYNVYQVSGNPAENQVGKGILVGLFGQEAQHMAWVRHGNYPNGVYNCPFPYRPTAIVKGVLQEWAKELVAREGFRHA
jgi:hypothetical protein